MADLFITQFCYNIDVALTKLKIMHKNESFPTYVGRFRFFPPIESEVRLAIDGSTPEYI